MRADFGVGRTSITGVGPAVNQLTLTGGGIRSQARRAPETSVPPALFEPVAITPIGTVRHGWASLIRRSPVADPTVTTLTGALNATLTGAPAFG